MSDRSIFTTFSHDQEAILYFWVSQKAALAQKHVLALYHRVSNIKHADREIQ